MRSGGEVESALGIAECRSRLGKGARLQGSLVSERKVMRGSGDWQVRSPWPGPKTPQSF